MLRPSHALYLLAAGALVACSGDSILFSNGTGTGGSGGSGGDGGTSDTTTTTTTSVTTTTTTSVGGGGGTGATGGGGSGANGGAGGDMCDNPGPTEDWDGDGYSINQGDCDDCDALVGPNSIEILGDLVDDDCDMSLTNTLATCDDNIDLDEDNPVVALNAIELCKTSSGPNDWGVVSATWVQADGSPAPVALAQNAAFHLGHGVFDGFGPNVSPRNGSHILALSNDQARRPTDPDPVTSTDKMYASPYPAGFPKMSSTCMDGASGDAQDSVAIEAVIRTPENVTGFSFDFDFYTADYPQFICTVYDDGFAALLTPTPAGLLDANIAFNVAGDLFSVNGADFKVCGCMAGPPCMAGGKTHSCSLGTTQLMGTGFGSDTNGGEDNGATGWHVTSAPVAGGSEITMRFTVWDASDGVVSSTVLLDDWRWETSANVIVETVSDP